MRRFPLPLFLQFFEHHGLLDMTHRPQWYVVPGGSREYIRAMLAQLGDRLTVHLNALVQKVIRDDEIRPNRGNSHAFLHTQNAVKRIVS